MRLGDLWFSDKGEILEFIKSYNLLWGCSLILRLKRQYANLLEDKARKMFPVEACAMLFGETTQEEAVVKKVVVASNKLQSNVKFEIDPEVFARAFFEAEKEGLDLIGLFHSHPAPASPSSTDLGCMKLWADLVWLIFSSVDGKLAAYQMKKGKVVEVAIETGTQPSAE